MKSKGFTLIELLAVIVILGIIAAITIPKIQDTLYDSQDRAYDLLVEQIKNKANDYVLDNNLTVQVSAATPIDVYVYQLVNGGYIETKDLEDPRTPNSHIDVNNSYVRFMLVDGQLVYEAHFTSIS